MPSKAALGRACGVSRAVGASTAAAACCSLTALATAGDRGIRDYQRGQPAEDANPDAEGENLMI